MRINFKRLDHVQLCIPPGAETRAREFYAGVLGLAEIEKPAPLKGRGGLWFEIADIQLHLGAHGVRLKEEPSIPGARRLSFFDPFGNRIELLERTNAV